MNNHPKLNLRFIRAAALFAVPVMLAGTLQTTALAENTAKLNTLTLYSAPDGTTSYWADKNGSETAPESGAKENEAASSVLPNSYSSVSENIITNVKNQYDSSSCWAFSSIACLETSAVLKGFESTESADFSESHLVWFTHNSLTSDTSDSTSGDGYSTDSPYAKGGYWYSAIFTLARGSGVSKESDYPFSSDLTANGSYGEESRYDSSYRLYTAQRLDSYNSATAKYVIDRNEVKNAVMTDGCVKVSYYSADSYYTTTPAGGSAYYQKRSLKPINHAVTIVGWDNNYSKANFKDGTQPASDGAWLIKNSYGAACENSEDGYFWLSYSEPTLKEFITYTVAEESIYDNIYQYDGFGYGESLSFDGMTSIYGGNVFTSDRDEDLNHVGFYTVQDDVNYTVKVYTNLSSDYENPADGTLAETFSGSCGKTGYYTIPLKNAVELSKGEIFSVVVEFSTKDGSDAYISAEGGQRDGAYYSSEANRSFYGCGTTWYDAHQSHNDLNIKAMTSDASCRHSYTSEVVPPTCDEKGYTLYTCSKCGDTYISDYTDANGHTWDSGVVTSNAGCQKKGITTYTCTSCGEIITKENIPVDLTAHEFSEWTVTSSATCVDDGEKTRVCSLCGKTETEIISALGHTDADGNGICDVCGETLTTGITFYPPVPEPEPDSSITEITTVTDETDNKEITTEKTTDNTEQSNSLINFITGFFARLSELFRNLFRIA